MSDPTPTIGDPQDEFTLAPRTGESLSELVAAGEFDQVHFFLQEALKEDVVHVAPTGGDVTFALLPYEHPTNTIDDAAFESVEELGFEQATFCDLLHLAIERPNLQREYDIIALGTLRTRRVFEEREGETVWDQNERDRSICQWATGLSTLKERRTLVPVEIYLDKVLRKDCLLLVRRS